MISQFWKWLGARTKRFADCTSGASAVEYSVFVGMIVGGALFGSEFLGLTVQNAFAQAANPLVRASEQAERREAVVAQAAVAEPVQAGTD